MQRFMFIHGTGVREPGYTASFNVIQAALTSRLGASHVRLEPCYWGESCGTKLFRGGASIPDFDTTRSVESETYSEAEYDLALWSMLYDNPAAELQLLALRPSSEAPPGREPPGRELERRFRTLTTGSATRPPDAGAELGTQLDAAGLLSYIDAARDAILERPSFRKTMDTAVEPLADYRLALARALVACAVVMQVDENQVAGSYVALDGTARDRIVELLVDALGGRERSPAGWVQAEAGKLVAGLGTRWFARRRGRLSDQMAPVGADILAYQARPAPFRNFIRAAANAASSAARARGESGEIIIFAHSLGGIAAVETLIEAPLEPVRRLITLGSQAPVLYELDALGSLPLPRDAAGHVSDASAIFPDHFPRAWLNVYDRNDFLSYRGAGVFAGRIKDVEVDNRQPFPQAHGAYWTNAAVWDAVAAFARESA